MLDAGRHPAGRLRAGAVAASSSAATRLWLETDGRRRAVRPRRPQRRGLRARGGRAAAAAPVLRPDARPRGCARYLRAHRRCPALLPEWALRALEEPRRLRAPARRRGRLRRLPRARHPARRDRDRLALGDAVQHLGVQPPPVPRRRRGWSRACAPTGVRTVVWVTPWVNLDVRRRPASRPTPRRERLHREPASNYAEGARGGPLRARRRRRAVRRALVDGHRLAGRLHLAGGRGVVARAGQARARARRARASRPTTARATTSRDDVAFADGRTGRRGGAGRTGLLYRRSMQRALDEVHPGEGVLFGRCGLDRPAGGRRHLGRRPGVGLLVAAHAGGGDAHGGRQRASRTGRTTSAATSASAWSSAARRSCCCAGCSSAASRR